jgi:hypothetical protein
MSTSKCLWIYLLTCLLTACLIQAEVAGSNCGRSSLCSCGCGCKAPCACGRMEGRPCTCKNHSQSPRGYFVNEQSCECGCNCEAPCACGCAEGQPCMCEASGLVPMPSFQNESIGECCDYQASCHEDCQDDHACTCKEGKCEEYSLDDELRHACDAYSSPCSDRGWYAIAPLSDAQFARMHGMHGIWFPEAPMIFKPFIADPRQIVYSIGWRFDDEGIAKNVIDFSFGDSLPIYRWVNIWGGGDLQVDIEGAVWDVFAPLELDCPMVNADYYVGFPVTYGIGKWAFRLRGYHISSHIGDEWLIDHPGFDRRNLSNEYLDFYVSYYITCDIRLYGGLGWVCLQDESFKCGDWYTEAGAELHFSDFGYLDYRNRMYGEPFFAMHFRYQPDYKHHINSTYVLGFEWGKFSGLKRKVRIFLEYHDGYSVEGQFCKIPTNYLSIRASYGF